MFYWILGTNVDPTTSLLYGDTSVVLPETKCWTPAHFANPHVEFANAVCGDQIRHNKTLSLPYDYEESPFQESTINDIINKKPKGECLLFLVLCVELILLTSFYSAMPKKSSNEDLDEKLKEIQGQGQEVKVKSRYCGVRNCLALWAVQK